MEGQVEFIIGTITQFCLDKTWHTHQQKTHASIIITQTFLMDMMTTNQVVCILLTFTDGDEDRCVYLLMSHLPFY